ncbi:hypothetical protein Tco_1123473 [Tanacetum coccineum]|uniref:Uncharacterized protein n=1 Tax=Tanacetum coccineum TaxID=301880 RepID=A0ABQ5J3G7_9ASTR
MESVKKSIDERAKHKEEYDSWVNERQIQTTEDKVDTGKAVDASLVNIESIGTESKEARILRVDQGLMHIQKCSLMQIMIIVVTKFLNEVNSRAKVVPTGKIFTSSTTKVDSEPTNGSNDDITNQYECKQTLDVQCCTLNIHAGSGLRHPRQITSDHNSLELEIHDHSNELSSSKLVPNVVPPETRQNITKRVGITITITNNAERNISYALSWKPCQGDSLNLPDHRIHKDGDGDASFQLKSNSLPHAHAQTTKTFYKHQDSRIMKAQELKTKTSAQTLIYKIFLQRYQVYQGRLLASFQDDARNEHVVAFDLLRDALSAIFGLSELKEIKGWDARDALGYILDCTLKDLAFDVELEEPMKDQPLSADASPTALSPGHIADSNPEEDKEDPEEDPADHPANG